MPTIIIIANNMWQRRHATAEGRLREALASGDAHAAVVQLKHFARSLQSMQLTNPAQARCLA